MPELTYHYDETGRATHVELAGDRRALSADDYAPEDPTRVVDHSTSVRATSEQIEDSYKDQSIVVDIEATHGGYFNSNRYFYLADGMKRAVKTWTAPHGKPYLVNHDKHGEPRGRVIGAKFIPTGKAMGYHALDVKIGHPEEIQMVLDLRALTVSTGSRAVDTVECSNCSHDLYRDGRAPKPYRLDKAPSSDWLDGPAPGIYGTFGMTNAELWDYKEDGQGKDKQHWVTCRHMRGIDAPQGGTKFETLGWYMHEMAYDEVSRVNTPADVNEATGEFAHIRGLLAATDALDEDTRAKHIVEALSRRPAGRARFQICSEKELFRADSAEEAVRYARKTKLSTFFDAGLWALQEQAFDAVDAQVRGYHAAGGRFIERTPRVSAADALAYDDPKAWGRWLRAQSELTRDDKAALDRVYLARYAARQRA